MYYEKYRRVYLKKKHHKAHGEYVYLCYFTGESNNRISWYQVMKQGGAYMNLSTSFFEPKISL